MNTRQKQSDSSRFAFSATLLALLTLAACGFATLTGCGGSDDGANSGSGGSSGSTAVKETPPKEAIAMLYYKDDSPFNAAFRAGATDSAKEQKAEIEWLDVGPDESQDDVFARAIKEKYAAICVCPLTPDVLDKAVKQAADAKIPVVVCERPLKLEGEAEGPAVAPFVATDHAYCGQVLADQAKKVIDEDGVLLLIGGEIGVEADRAMNVNFALKETKIKVVADSDIALELQKKEEGESPDPAASPITTVEALNKFVEEHEDESMAIVAVSAAGAKEVLAWKKSDDGKEHKDVPLLGFGSWDGLGDAIESGLLTAVVLEDPNGIGAAAVMTAASVVAGEEVGELVVTGEHLVTAENLEDERTAELLRANIR